VIFIFSPPGRPEVQWPGSAPLPGIAGKLGLPGYDGSSCEGRQSYEGAYTLNRQFGMGVFKMGWISKTTMQELDCVQAVLQLLHEPFIFVHAGPSLTFNIHLKCHTVQHAESRDPVQP
jgi:hypothetical protein